MRSFEAAVITKTNSNCSSMKVSFGLCLIIIACLKNSYPAFKSDISNTISGYTHKIISMDSYGVIGQVLKVNFDWVD